MHGSSWDLRLKPACGHVIVDASSEFVDVFLLNAFDVEKFMFQSLRRVVLLLGYPPELFKTYKKTAPVDCALQARPCRNKAVLCQYPQYGNSCPFAHEVPHLRACC